MSSGGATAELVVSFGEMLIDFVPDVAGVSLAESGGFIKAPGGAPANVAVAITKLGGRSAFIGKVSARPHPFRHWERIDGRISFGDDEFGHMLADILKKNGVEDEGVRFDPNARTALAFVTLKSNGEREFMFYRNPSADMLLTEADLNLSLIKRAKIFHYGSISLISEPCRSAHLAAMRAAKQAGIFLSYDPNVRLPLWPSEEAARTGIKSIWKEPDFIKNEEKLKQALTFANACGAICTTKKGAIPALPTASMAMELVAKAK
ncbi:hypothetical protein BHE74_00017723 [Ensete ventricosum]|uniref:Carbohydrate kinase PfkB domain-containing protein n=1 Tax=Ensete ventricosum TaxID=4639 RepID=A0A426Y9G7_ENSVE|nr:hypothetical protein B296_00035886 [Ensete ventricosum]RWW74338.1 hypothetical protein BHE74_00017723 [Ensete ventricosum]